MLRCLWLCVLVLFCVLCCCCRCVCFVEFCLVWFVMLFCCCFVLVVVCWFGVFACVFAFAFLRLHLCLRFVFGVALCCVALRCVVFVLDCIVLH